ncbi:hypothetical protein EOD42_22445 [Rhodovarius crocodyli]|uniref:Uncharacterized protein n=1 Tax=Rhodovarius crocodyli TaxID=1979269 RepID=A0A437M165_9PROT|nr:hypothetical protein [Rhodovarius crocodyli]RVT91418.1 hypothetical protein EOD42_22445 [Rhodovarius crocodyli]
MAKTTPDTLPQPDPATEPLTLDQWAQALSKTDRRVELLNAFVATQRAAGIFTRTATEWGVAYAAFGAQPA